LKTETKQVSEMSKLTFSISRPKG